MTSSKNIDLRFARYYDDCGDPIIQPLDTLEGLLEWVSDQDESCVCRIPLQTPPTRTSPLRTLVCHDLSGGYSDDRFPQGVCFPKKVCYRFTHWHMVDTFVYFSHRFITIPPPGWVAGAHKHGVKILGTFITEWDDGCEIMKAVLKSEDSMRAVVKQMTAIAQYYNFDGWLINIENSIELSSVEMLVQFVKELTETTKAAIHHSEVIWYDSVTTAGELVWQNALNDLNSRYFDVCDGIFLNYTWTEDNLKASREYAKNRHRPHDVYVGVDVFGRGCHGGGGFNTAEAVGLARANHLSVALFAQGWTYQCLPKEDFVDNEHKFWGLLSEFCPMGKMRSLPFVTNFCQGFGQDFFSSREKGSPTPWYNMACQSIQTNGLNSFKKDDSGKCENGVVSLYTEKDSKDGFCLKLDGDAQEPGNKVTFSLFQIDAKLPEAASTRVVVSWKPITELTEMFLDLKVQCGNDCKDYRLFTVQKGSMVGSTPVNSRVDEGGQKEDPNKREYNYDRPGSIQDQNITIKSGENKLKLENKNISGATSKTREERSEPLSKTFGIENHSGPEDENKSLDTNSESVEESRKLGNNCPSKSKTENEYLPLEPFVTESCPDSGWKKCTFKIPDVQGTNTLLGVHVGLTRSSPGPMCFLLGSLQVTRWRQTEFNLQVTFHKFSQSEREEHGEKLGTKSGWMSFKVDLKAPEYVEHYSVYGAGDKEDHRMLGQTCSQCFCLPLYTPLDPSLPTPAQPKLLKHVEIRAVSNTGYSTSQSAKIPDDFIQVFQRDH